MLQRKRPCQTQAGNNGGQPWGNRSICMQLFAVSTTTKANQKNLNGGWQASTNAFALCLCELTTLGLPSKTGPVLFLGWSDIPPPLFLTAWSRVIKGRTLLHSWKLAHKTYQHHRMCCIACCLQPPNGNISTPKPRLSLFHLQRFKIYPELLCGLFQMHLSTPRCHFQC